MARKKSNITAMVTKETLIKYMNNLVNDGGDYILFFYPNKGEGFIAHTFSGPGDSEYRKDVGRDLILTTHEILTNE